MKGDQVEKKILEVDGEELEGLISLDEYTVEDDTVDVAGRDKTVPIRNGVKKIPPIPGIFKITRGSRTLKFLQDWYYQKQTKNVVLIRTDGAGNEFSRELWLNVEMGKSGVPAYDAAAPVPAQTMVTFLPEDITPIDAE